VGLNAVREVELLESKDHLVGLAVILSAGAIVYMPFAAPPGATPADVMEWCLAVEMIIPGARVTYLPPSALLGPSEMLGKERVRIELVQDEGRSVLHAG